MIALAQQAVAGAALTYTSRVIQWAMNRPVEAQIIAAVSIVASAWTLAYWLRFDEWPSLALLLPRELRGGVATSIA